MNVLEPEVRSSTASNYDLLDMDNQNDQTLFPVNQRQPIAADEKDDVPTPAPESYIESYTVAWICALQEEFQAACQMLDVDDFEAPKGMETCTNDRNVYVFGQLGLHYVVVGCLPRGRLGLVNAANVARDMIRSFPNLKFALMVGIGGGAPTKKRDIRLGDVVVSVPSGDHGGVVQLDFGTRLPNGMFKRKGQLNSPPDALLAATHEVQRILDNPKKQDRIAEHMARMDHMSDYDRPSRDRLYRSDYIHQEAGDAQDEEDEDEDGCKYCKEDGLVPRKDRKSFRKITVHYGTIASDNVAMRDAVTRDKHARDKELNILCFEMEAGGLMNNIQCLVIRGICDYSDSHKNDDWQKYAALSAAAYARELLLVLRPQTVAVMPSWDVEMKQLGKQLKEINQNQQVQKLVSLKDRLMAGDRMASALANNQDTYEKACKDHHGGTCKWLFDRNEFRNWIGDGSAHPVLWLNGKHGAGKTVLCAAAIKHLTPNESLSLMETDATNLSPSKSSPIVVRQFLSKDAYIPQRQLLRITATQLMDSLVKLGLDSIPNSILPFLNITNDESKSLQDLIDAILLELPLTYIFIDGLDDAEYADIPTSTPKAHPPADVKLFVEFLIKKALDNPEKVRLWLSSQPLPDIRQYVCNPERPEPDRVGEIQLTTNDTHDDIMSYLSHYIPSSTKDKSDLAKAIVQGALKTEVEGSFLWASEMVNDIKDETEDEDDVIDLVKEGLPLEMGKLYEKAIRRIIENNKRPKHPPLWKVILSLLAFAKRPLKMSEVMEAIAILRTSSGNNMKENVVHEEKILKCCLSLVRHAPRISDGRNVGLVRFSHSAVRAFLLNKSESKIDSVSKNLPLVENWIIRDCCLQYLSQPRYGALLEKRTSTEFRTLDGVSALARQFLLYAAKYWFQHFDSPDKSNDTVPADCDATAVRVFLRSPNFRTTMQIQSLFITGHFLQSFDSITDSGLSVRRTLPNWMQKHEPELHRQYQAFQGEWSRLLQSKRSDSFHGEINRCFWGALGSENFLSSDADVLGRYDSFEFSKGKESRREGDSCQVHHISQDGQRLVTGWVRTQENQKQICVEMWTLDGKSHPRAKPMTTMPFSATDTSMALYTLPCSQSFYSIPLIPRVDSVVPPDAIALRLDGSIIRLGSKIFRKETTDSLSHSTGFSELTGKAFGDSWEEVCIRDPFLVVCRRRIYRKRPQTGDEEREGKRVHQLRRRMSVHERSRSRSRTRSVSPLPRFLEDLSSIPHLPRQIPNKVIEDVVLSFNFPVADSDDQSSGYISNSETNSTSSRGLSDWPSAEESWSEGMSSTDDPSSDEIASQEPEEPEADDTGDGLDVRSQRSEDDDSDIKSVLSAKSANSQATNRSGSLTSLSLSQILSNSSSESDDGEIQSGISEDETLHAEPAVVNPEPEGPVVIGKSNGRVQCDSCGKRRLRTWYHCIICNDANFDLCDRCERKGVWCLDISHQLYKIINRNPSGVVSRRSFDVRQHLTVYRTDVPGEKPTAFQFRKKYSIMLYDSPPVIHQKHPLVIWALSDSRLLFADLAHNQFFEQKIAAGLSTKKAHPICVSLSFSPCGKFLRMAIIDVIAEKPKPTIGSMAHPISAPKARLCLNLHVLVLQLSSSQPARNRPKLLASTSCRLGCSCARAFVPTLPFAFTWGSSDLYLTLSDSSLRVYRILLPGIDVQSSETGSVDQVNKAEFKFMTKVPKEIILLPRSSRNRSVQFFPARKRDTKATVIIGPRYGQNPAPPIGVYLSEKDLGGWTDLEEMGDSEGNVYSSQKTLGAQFEEPWDENQDCILIPFEGY